MRATFLVCALLLCSVASLPQEVPPPSRTVYFSAVSKKGQPVALSPEQLEFSQGIKLKSLKSLSRPPISYVVAFDMSNSEREKFSAQVNFAKRLLAEVIRPQVDSGLVVAFDSSAYATPVTQDPASLVKAMDKFRPGGASAVYDSIIAGAQILLRQTPDQPRILFLISDGDDNQSRMTRSDTVAVLIRGSVRAFCLYPVPTIETRLPTRGEQALRLLADQTGGEFIPIESQGRFSNALALLSADLASSYRAEFELPNGEKPGFHALQVRPHEKSITLHIPSLYLIEKQSDAALVERPESGAPVIK